MENPEKISLQFELLNTYYSKIACKMSHTPNFCRKKLVCALRQPRLCTHTMEICGR